MAESADSIPRPVPLPTLAARAASWLAWVGTARLVAVSLATVAVVGGSWWLVRTPPQPPEASMPMARPTPPPTSAPPRPVTESVSVHAPDGDGTVIVHVAGEVMTAGVHEVPADARVHDAIAAAGGLAGEADVDRLNLAAPVADGQRIYVPAHGEVVPVEVVADVVDEREGEPTGPVDVNDASVDALQALPGVGPATAAAIVDERTRNGPFASVDDLERVAGIGPSKLEALRGLVIV